MRFSPGDVKTVEIDLTTMCNAKCPLCSRQTKWFADRFSTPFQRPASEILMQLRGFPALETVHLIGQVSEPTTHDEFLGIVEELKSRNMKLKICTNGHLHDDAYWKTLGKTLSAEDEVWFAICGSTQELHSKYRVGTDLSRILSHAAALRSERRVDGAKCIRFRYNEEDLASDAFKVIVSRFSKVEYVDTCMQPNNELEEFLPPKDVLAKYRVLDRCSRTMDANCKGNDCQSVFEGQVHMGPHGEIYPCYRYFENSDGAWDGDYGPIERGDHWFCRFCNRNVLKMVDGMGMGDIV